VIKNLVEEIGKEEIDKQKEIQTLINQIINLNIKILKRKNTTKTIEMIEISKVIIIEEEEEVKFGMMIIIEVEGEISKEIKISHINKIIIHKETSISNSKKNK